MSGKKGKEDCIKEREETGDCRKQKNGQRNMKNRGTTDSGNDFREKSEKERMIGERREGS